jgi:acyl-coenzyme A thioesterase PaaI-like protein
MAALRRCGLRPALGLTSGGSAATLRQRRHPRSMTFFHRVVGRLGKERFLKLMRFYPPYLGAGVSVVHVAPDLSALEVEMRLSPWNRNFVGTQFGGSLYSMCDPFFMLMLLMQLGPEYVIWDKSASIEFLRPARGRVRARFQMPPELVAKLKRDTDVFGKINPRLEVKVLDEQGEVVARVSQVLSIRRKDKQVDARNAVAAAEDSQRGS